jgi:hypothetical protein
MDESNKDADSRFYTLINKSSDEVSLLKLVVALVKAGEHWAVIGENNSSFLLYKQHIHSVKDGLGNYVKGIYVGKLDNEDTFINVTGKHFNISKGDGFNFDISQEPPQELVKKIFFQYAQLFAEDYVPSCATKNRQEGFIKKTTIGKFPEDLHKLDQILYEIKS